MTDPTQTAATTDRAADYRRLEFANSTGSVGSNPPVDDGQRGEDRIREDRDGPAGAGDRPVRTGDDTPAYPDTSVAVVVPAYNEVEHVGAVLDEIPPYVDRIYAVDDASTDGTWDEIRERVPTDSDELSAAGTDCRLMPIRHEENQGAGAALRTGYLTALDEGIDVTVTIDADGQMDPALMPDLVDPVAHGPADYAKGNRLAEDLDREEMPPFRRLGNWLLTYLTKVASGYWGVMDPQNGYTAISGDALEAVDIESLSAGHEYTNDLLVRLQVAGMSVTDVPIPVVYDDEDSTIDYVEFIPTTSITLLHGFLWRLDGMYLPGSPTLSPPNESTDRNPVPAVTATDGGTAGVAAPAVSSESGPGTGPGDADTGPVTETGDAGHTATGTRRAADDGDDDSGGNALFPLSALVGAFLGGIVLAWALLSGGDPAETDGGEP